MIVRTYGARRAESELATDGLSRSARVNADKPPGILAFWPRPSE